MTAERSRRFFASRSPPLKLALHVRYLERRREALAAAHIADAELANVERISVQLARDGHWN
jgi:hypothetical protein